MGCVNIKGLIKFLLSLILLAAILWVYARFIEPSLLQTKNVELKSEAVEGTFKIAILSDVHLGRGVDTRRLERIVERVNMMNADCVVFLGDLYDNYSKYTGNPAADVAALSKLAAGARLAVWGNHDMGGGAFKVFGELMEAAGFKLLENEFSDVGGNIRISGVENVTFGHPDVQGLKREGMYNVLLCHEPDFADSVQGFDLQLSGHSHGGQVYIPLIGAPVLPQGAKNYVRGLYQKSDGQVYVSRGIGTSILPYRFFAVPEITLVTINKE